MGKKSNAKKVRRESNHTQISGHKRQGKKLIPPFQQIDKLKKVSWTNDRLPEYIWISLIISISEREEGIQLIKRITKFFYDIKEEYRPEDLSISSLSKLDDHILDSFLEFMCDHLGLDKILQPLALFDEIPRVEKWRQYLSDDFIAEEEWEKLFITVAKCFDHQSQEATDSRWSRLYYYFVCGKLGLQGESAKQIFHYPDEGDMRSVRPLIRSTEMVLNMQPDGGIKENFWIEEFWKQGMQETRCWKLNSVDNSHVDSTITRTDFEKVKDCLIVYFNSTNTTTGVDPKHDAVFGLSLYSIEILGELIEQPYNTSILSRLGLRTITECYITLAYLCDQNNDDLWQAYRIYGSGQAKLTFLKMDEMEVQPKFVDTETLRTLANEDQYEEFVDIDLGHWDSTNLRKMSEKANVKEEYNKFYDWTSGFAHGQWSAVRNTTFDTCGNPMHRLHRIPKEEKVIFNDASTDAKDLCNKILELVDKMYEGFTVRFKM